MLITSIEKQKNNENRYSIFIDNKFEFGLDKKDVLYLNLKEKTIISKEKLEYIKKYIIFEDAKNKALRFLSFSSRSKKEIFLKLSKENFEDDIIYEVISFLEKYSFIDDYKYAKSYFRNKSSSLYGKIKIMYELEQKGIDKEIINDVFEEENIDQQELVLKLFHKKSKNKNLKDYKEKRHIFNYILGRGFSYEDVKDALNSFFIDT